MSSVEPLMPPGSHCKTKKKGVSATSKSATTVVKIETPGATLKSNPRKSGRSRRSNADSGLSLLQQPHDPQGKNPRRASVRRSNYMQHRLSCSSRNRSFPPSRQFLYCRETGPCWKALPSHTTGPRDQSDKLLFRRLRLLVARMAALGTHYDPQNVESTFETGHRRQHLDEGHLKIEHYLTSTASMIAPP